MPPIKNILPTVAIVTSIIATTLAIAGQFSFKGNEARETKQDLCIERLQSDDAKVLPLIAKLQEQAAKNESLLIVIDERLRTHTRNSNGRTAAGVENSGG